MPACVTTAGGAEQITACAVRMALALKPCPFCGGRLNFHREDYVNRFGKSIIKQYWMHDDTDCVLSDINQPFVLGAGDANPETGYPGEYAEKWNRRVDHDTN